MQVMSIKCVDTMIWNQTTWHKVEPDDMAPDDMAQRQCSPYQVVTGKIYHLKQQFLPPATS
ncbi:hypothetical protein P5673_008211 [Acropora cervicornis]|uniref:Uncharacterized protein n=1 Tax=Acropora cervicornis TaxID=6130 RepID=A0AAD9QU41_ACRCE|nr:hypothetical protein P5673_008211 [Acropora cervicornis]